MTRVISILFALGLFACGDNSPASPVCANGAQLACRCADGAPGVATCDNGGMSFGRCACGSEGVGGGSLASSSSSAMGGTSSCPNDLSNIGNADFHISLYFATAQSASLVAVANQRSVCAPSNFWEVRLNDGNVQMDTDDGTTLVELVGTTPVNDGIHHQVDIGRNSGLLTIQVDAHVAGSTQCTTAFGALPPIAIGTDVCTGTDGTVPFNGEMGTLCVTSP